MGATDQREVAPFNGVDFRGIGRLVLSQGEQQAVILTASEAVLPHVRTDVRAGVLIVSLRWWPGMIFRISELKGLHVQVVTPHLCTLKVSGAGFVESREKILVEDMNMTLSGAGEIRLQLQGHRLVTRLSGAGRIVLWGEVEEQEIRLSGAGSVQTEKMLTSSALIRSTGAGECRVHATDTLDVRLSGAGSIRYLGSPRIQSRISGVGTLSPMN
jgi:hypothetical protein